MTYQNQRRYTGIEMILDIYNYDRYWMYIPGFSGYEISNDNIIRSMKHYKKYPYGILIKPIQEKQHNQDLLFELSDDNNKRVKIRLSELRKLAEENKNSVMGYPCHTTVRNVNSRNKYVKNSEGVYVKVYNGPGVRKRQSIEPLDNTISFPKFTVIRDN